MINRVVNWAEPIVSRSVCIVEAIIKNVVERAVNPISALVIDVADLEFKCGSNREATGSNFGGCPWRIIQLIGCYSNRVIYRKLGHGGSLILSPASVKFTSR